MKIFLDVGAHFGECALRALNPRFRFDLVVAYEPSSVSQKRLRRIKDSRLLIRPFGLGGKSEQKTLFGAGHLGASLYSDKKGLVRPDLMEKIEIRTAHKELADYLRDENEVWLKINCEGGEIAIIQDLYDHSILNKFDHIWIDWDARKIPSLKDSIEKSSSLLIDASARFVNAHDFESTGWIGVEKWIASSIDNEHKRSSAEQDDFRIHSLLKFPFSLMEFLKLRFPTLWRYLAHLYHQNR